MTAVLIVLLIVVALVASANVWLCRNAMRSGSVFEGEIGNRWLSMKVRTTPPSRSPGATGDE